MDPWRSLSVSELGSVSRRLRIRHLNCILEASHFRELGRTSNDLRELERISPEAYVDRLNSIKSQFSQVITEKYESALNRSRTRGIVEEQPSRPMLSVRRQAASGKKVLEIDHKESTYSDTPGIIGLSMTIMRISLETVAGILLGKATRFHYDFPRLQEEQRAVIEGALLDEIKSAVSFMQVKNTPGADRLSSEF